MCEGCLGLQWKENRKARSAFWSSWVTPSADRARAVRENCRLAGCGGGVGTAPESPCPRRMRVFSILG